MIIKKRIYRKKCSSCKSYKKDTRIRICGYDKDVNNKKIKELICNDCENNHLDDI